MERRVDELVFLFLFIYSFSYYPNACCAVDGGWVRGWLVEFKRHFFLKLFFSLFSFSCQRTATICAVSFPAMRLLIYSRLAIERENDMYVVLIRFVRISGGISCRERRTQVRYYLLSLRSGTIQIFKYTYISQQIFPTHHFPIESHDSSPVEKILFPFLIFHRLIQLVLSLGREKGLLLAACSVRIFPRCKM